MNLSSDPKIDDLYKGQVLVPVELLRADETWFAALILHLRSVRPVLPVVEARK